MLRREALFTEEEWADIVLKSARALCNAPASAHTESNMIRLALGFPARSDRQAVAEDAIQKAMEIMQKFNSCPVLTIEQANRCFQQVGSILESAVRDSK